MEELDWIVKANYTTKPGETNCIKVHLQMRKNAAKTTHFGSAYMTQWSIQ